MYVHYPLLQNKKEIKLWGGGEKGRQLFKTGIFGHSFFKNENIIWESSTKIRLFLSTIYCDYQFSGYSFAFYVKKLSLGCYVSQWQGKSQLIVCVFDKLCVNWYGSNFSDGAYPDLD